MKKGELSHWKLTHSRSTNNKISAKKFQFDLPMNVMWKSRSRNISSENVLDLSDTCIYDEEKLEQSPRIFDEDFISPRNTLVESLTKENFDLVAEVKSLRSELEELKAVVKDLQQFKQEIQSKPTRSHHLFLDRELSSSKKLLKPPLPIHRIAKSTTNLF